jgi:hypothetical protein
LDEKDEKLKSVSPKKIKDILDKNGSVEPKVKKAVVKELIESGYFEKYTITGADGEKHTNTTRYTKNYAKVIIAKCGNVEYSCYPHDFPDKVFIHISGGKAQIDRFDVNRYFSAMNQIKWYLNGGCQKAISGKSKTQLAKDIKLAYEYVVNQELGQ